MTSSRSRSPGHAGDPGPEPPADVRAAVEEAGRATAATRLRHLAADRRDAGVVADQAAQDAVATRYRVEAEAVRVRHAADRAAVEARLREVDPTSGAALARAAEIEATVAAAAIAVQERSVVLASSVAGLVAGRAAALSASRPV